MAIRFAKLLEMLEAQGGNPVFLYKKIPCNKNPPKKNGFPLEKCV